MSTHAIIGLGYVAPKHLDAIKAVGGELVAACDLRDVAGILDSYAPGCRFFQDPCAFFCFCEDAGVEWVSVCTPNHLHAAHARIAHRAGCKVIVEKPVCLNEQERRAISETGAFPVMQLRHLQSIKNARAGIMPADNVVDVEYMTHRGLWYDQSWKGDER
jgi:UDP-N-acetyl-2-amino-2-deoxyglucuronate dehydrogenase